MPPIRRTVVVSSVHSELDSTVRRFVSDFDECLILLPRRSGEGLHPLTGAGRAGIHLRTIPQLASELARAPMALKGLAPLGTLAGEAVVARIVYQAHRRDSLRYFGPVAKSPGFPRALTRTLLDLRLSNVRPEDLTAAGLAGPDLSLLLDAYERQLSDYALSDLADIFRFGEETLGSGAHRYHDLPLVLFDAPLQTVASRQFVGTLSSRSPSVLAALSQSDPALEELLGVSATKLKSTGTGGPLDHLRRFLFDPASKPYSARPGVKSTQRFELFSSPGEGLESAEIARRILTLAKEGVAFDQIAILLRSPERYQPVIEEALRRASIPAYFSRGTTRPDPTGRAFLALLNCAAEKVSASRFAEYLSLGQFPSPTAPSPWVPPDDEVLGGVSGPEPDATPTEPAEPSSIPAPRHWEELLVDAAVIGGRDRWRRRLDGREKEWELQLADLDSGEFNDAQRERLMRRLQELRSLKAFALPIVDALHDLPVAAPWAEWLAQLDSLARLTLRHADGVLAVLAELAPMSDVGPVGLEEVAEVLADRLRFLRREPSKRRWGQVFVGSIEECRARSFPVVFLPGLAEGLFPQRAAEDPLLLDFWRKDVCEHLPLRSDAVADERKLLHLAAGAAADRLIASYPRMDVAAARPRVPSFYALELPRAIFGQLPDLKEFENNARDAAPARLNRPAPATTAEAIDDAEYDLVAIEAARQRTGHARYLLETNADLARAIRARWSRWRPSWKESDGLITASPDALEALATFGLSAHTWSPSSLEKFATCPYQFALYGIYRLEPREEAQSLDRLDPRTRGALFHAVQFAFLNELKAAALLPVNQERLVPVTRIVDRVLDTLAAKYADDLAPAIPRVWTSEIENLRTDLHGWLQHIARNDDEWEPVHFEFAFGLKHRTGRDTASSSEDIALAEGVRLRGSIDLVERHTTTGQYRITDHKTGKPPEKIPLWVGGGKHLQPLLYSLAAEAILNVTVEYGRLFYATQRGGYQQMAVKLDRNSRLVMKRLMADIDSSILTGFLPPFPAEEACSLCDYRGVCGPYEERRSRKKRRGDERLEALLEIRSMA